MATADPMPIDTEEPPTPTNSLSTGDLIDLFAHDRRRSVLVVLRREDRAMALSELAEWIVTHEEGTPPNDVSAAQRDLVAESLRRVHLPRLDDANFLVFESHQEIVSPV